MSQGVYFYSVYIDDERYETDADKKVVERFGEGWVRRT